MDWQSFFRSNLEQVETYRPGLREEQVRELVEADDLYKLSSNESPLPPFPAALEALQGKLSTLNEYPDGSSYELTQYLSEHYHVPAEEIVIGNGSNELIDLIAATCLDPGDNAVYPWPSFVVYRSSTLIQNAECREVPLKGVGQLDLDGMLARIDGRTKVVYICTPNNPSGATVGKAEFEAFLERVPDHVLVVADAAYEEFIDDETAMKPLDYFDGKRPYAVLRTFSKMYALAGIRCGYGFAPAPLIEVLHKVREPFNVNTLAQAAAIASLKDGEELARRVALNKLGKERLQANFETLGLRYVPSQANFVWVEVADPAGTFDKLLKRGVIVRAFPGGGGLRVGIGDTQGVNATIAAFNEIFG
ncbi:MAG TPA: histidinol-phosphate transaminase [Coriobacteriia bacterium]|nr:histidinol-phosphate transaminase [Coriobacteriia bacterium]